MLFQLVLGNFWCSVVTPVTFHCNLSNIESKPLKNAKTNAKIAKISTISRKRKKNRKITHKNPQNAKNTKETKNINLPKKIKIKLKYCILLVLPIEEIILQPDLSSPSRFRITEGLLRKAIGKKNWLLFAIFPKGGGDHV